MTETTQREEGCAESVVISDEAIVRMLQARQEAGLQALLSKHGHATRITMERSLSRADLIDDAIAFAAQRIWENPQGIDLTRGNLGHYFYTIVRNAVRRLLRKERSERDLLSDLCVTGDGSQEPTVRQQVLLADLRVAIGRLAPLQQAIVRADLEEGGSAPAGPIAEAFGTTTNSVYVSRVKGHRRLRKLLQQRGYSPREDEGEGK